MPFGVTEMLTKRLQFVTLAKRMEKPFSELCQDFGVSRKTGYKWVDRFSEGGIDGLPDRTHACQRQPHAYGAEVVRLVVEARKSHPTWGPRKIVHRLRKEHPQLDLPAASTVGDMLKRAGLVRVRQRRRSYAPSLHPRQPPERCNEVWCADFKGWFRVGDGSRCDPLTITDAYSRMILCCTHVETHRVATR